MKRLSATLVRAWFCAIFLFTVTAAAGHAQSDTTRDTTRIIRLQPITVVGVNETVQTTSFLEWALRLQPAGANALETLNRAPGFNFTAGDAHGFYEYGQNTQLRVFNSQQLAMTLDGIPLGSQSPAGGNPLGRFVENESVERVTVHQGSGNIETVSSTGLGGAIEYRTTHPKRDASGELNLTGGRFDTRRVYGRFDTGEIGNGTSMYGSVSYNEFNKWRSLGDQVRTHFEAKVRQDFDGGSISVNGYFNKRDDHDFLDVTVDQFSTLGRDLDLSDTFVVLPDKEAQVDANALFYDAWSNGREDFLLGINLDFQPVERVTVAAVPYFQNQRGVGTWLPDYRPGVDTDDPLAAENRDQTRNTWRETQYGTNRFGLTTNVTFDVGDGHSITVGGWAEHQERMQRRVWFDIPNNDAYDINTIRDEVTPIFTQFDRDFTTNTFSGLVKGNFQVTPALRINAGVKAHAYNVDYFDSQSQSSSKFDDAVAFLPQLGLVYNVGDEHQLFGSVSRNFSEVPDGALTQVAPLEAETSVNLDAGYRFLRGGLATSVAFYFVDYSNKIEEITFGAQDRYAGESSLQNVGGIRAFGVELNGDYYFNNGFGIFASGSWSSSEYAEDVTDASETDAVLRVKGNQVVFTPTLQGFGELSYTTSGFTIAANAKYTGARPVSLSGPVGGDPSAQEELDSYVLIGGTASYEWRQFLFKMQGTNLTDESYLASTSGIGPGTARRPGGGTYFPGSPRWFTFGVGVSF